MKQISVFLENRKGRLAEITEMLTEAKVNIRALSLADTADFGVLRMIVADPEGCVRALRSQGAVVQETDVVAAEVEDKPGGLNRIVKILSSARINLEYMYAFVEKRVDNAIVVFKVDDPAEAKAVLKKNNVQVFSQNSVEL